MSNETTNTVSAYVGWAIKRLALVLFDILVVNASYYLALVVRFYVGGEFRPIALERYLPAFWEFAPYYTVLCIAVFAMCGLYSSRWRHAGLYDLNRIFLANVITASAYIAGTLLFVDRMPITYYFIGAVVQMMAIAASRFACRLVILEMKRLQHLSGTKMNVMIVGIGETARVFRNQIERDGNNVARPVCMFAYHDTSAGKMVNGLPVLNDVNKLDEYFKHYQIKCVILADSLMPAEIRKQIRAACQKNDIEVQDFSGYLTSGGSGVTLRKLMEYAHGAVEIKLDGETELFTNSEQALMAYPGKYEIKRIYANADVLGIEIAGKTVILNDTNADWVKDTENKSGAEISFF